MTSDARRGPIHVCDILRNSLLILVRRHSDGARYSYEFDACRQTLHVATTTHTMYRFRMRVLRALLARQSVARET